VWKGGGDYTAKKIRKNGSYEIFCNYGSSQCEGTTGGTCFGENSLEKISPVNQHSFISLNFKTNITAFEQLLFMIYVYPQIY
jgi:hypothetical protein